MKQSYTFLFIIIVNIFLQPMSSAAVTDWAREKTQQVRSAVAEKIQQTQQVTDQLQQALTRNANCLINGTCAGGEKERMVLLAKTVGITVGALVAIAATAGITAKLVSGKEEKITPTDAMFLKVAEEGLVDEVERRMNSELVRPSTAMQKKVLEYLPIWAAITPDNKPQYEKIKNSIQAHYKK